MFIYDKVIHFDVEAILIALTSRVTFNKSSSRSSSLHNMTMVWAVMKQKIASYLELIKVDCFIRIFVLQHHITYNHILLHYQMF